MWCLAPSAAWEIFFYYYLFIIENSITILLIITITTTIIMIIIIGYECSHDEDGAEDVVLEGEQRQTHVGEDEVLRQEVQHLEQLKWRRILILISVTQCTAWELIRTINARVQYLLSMTKDCLEKFLKVLF